MNFQFRLRQKNMTRYRLSKQSGVPYSTINDIYLGKTRISDCKAETVYKIAKILDISADKLIEDDIRCSFENFKSSECHELKFSGDIGYVCNSLKTDKIRKYYNQKWYPECFYCLAMLDYVSRENNIPICSDYDDIRQYKLSDILWPADTILQCAVFDSETPKEELLKNCLPEFLRYNIVEKDVRDAC